MHKSVTKSTFSLLNVDFVHLNKNWNYRKIISPFYRIYLIEKGSGTLQTASQTEVLEKGYLYLIPSYTMCNYSCTNYLYQYYTHVVEESADGSSLFLFNRKIFKVKASSGDFAGFRRLLEINPGRGLLTSDNPRDYERGSVIARFQELSKLLDDSRQMETQGIILQLLSRFLASGDFRQGTPASMPTKISNALHYIQTNLHREITVNNLAELANQNPDYFSRVFYDHLSERPLAYIQLRRIERAQFLITTTDLSLGDIAEQTGFESLSYFSRIFKKITGMTARDYRASVRNV